MLNPWFAATLLAFEATSVMHLRMVKIASGGGGAFEEAGQGRRKGAGDHQCHCVELHRGERGCLLVHESGR